MNNFLEKNNKVFISGEIISDAEFSHEVYGEGFYEMNVLVKRLSGQGDILPVTISERLISEKELKKGVNISAFGQFRSYNKLVDGKSVRVCKKCGAVLDVAKKPAKSSKKA